MNPGKVVTQYEFMDLFSRAWCKAITATILCLLIALLVSILTIGKLYYSLKSTFSSTGLAYISRYNPQNKRYRSKACSREPHPLIEAMDSDLPVGGRGTL